MEIASDLTYDRTKTFKTLVDNAENLIEALQECEGDARELHLPFFVTFARQPHGVAFRIRNAEPYEFLAVNAHLIFGDRIGDRRREFTALMELLKSRLADDDSINLILTGDLNLDFDDPVKDHACVDKDILKRFYCTHHPLKMERIKHPSLGGAPGAPINSATGH